MTKKITFLTLLSLLAWQCIFAQTTEPILRLNTEMHTARIKRISTDAQGKYVLTASNDKTAKLWSAENGELLKTFRPPIGHGNEGMLYAGTISPNAEIVAVAGWTGFDWDKSINIYIFNSATGALIQRLTGLGNVIFDLEFSPDGTYLAAALGGGEGVVIYKTNLPTLTGFKTLSELSIKKHKTISGYGKHSFNTAFSPNGELATVCFDGKIRLYDQYFNLTQETTGAGTQPFSIAFSPDGNRIAVGYGDAPEVDVFSAKNLKRLYQPPLDGMNKNAGLGSALCFSPDGKTLYGGGKHSKYIDGNGWFVIRKWAHAGQGSYTDYPACDNTVMDVKTNGRSSLLFGGNQPDFGRMDTYGRKLFYKTGEVHSFAAKDRSHFKISHTGDQIAFTPLYKNAMLFSVAERTLTGFETLSELESYTDHTSGTTVTNWEDTYSPSINNSKVNFLRQYERCRSTDISNDGNKIILG